MCDEIKKEPVSESSVERFKLKVVSSMTGKMLYNSDISVSPSKQMWGNVAVIPL